MLYWTRSTTTQTAISARRKPSYSAKSEDQGGLIHVTASVSPRGTLGPSAFEVTA